MPAVRRPWLWILTAALVVWGLIAAARGTAGLPPAPVGGGGHDLQMYAAVAERVAAGENYYRVLADELPARGYAVRPVFNWRLPTVTWLNVLPPSPYLGRALLAVLGGAVIVLGVMAIRRSVPRAATACLPVLLLGTAPIITFRSAPLFYEIWAGWWLFVSLASWALGWRKTSVVLGAAALATRELALPYVLIMAAAAWWESRRREAVAWLGVAGLFLLFWAWHVWNVLQVMPNEGLRNSWVAGGGWSFVLSTSHSSLFIMLLPEQWAAAVIVPLVWAGFWLWDDPFGRRMALVITGYFGLFMMVGRPDNWYWGFLLAPLIPLGAFGYFFGSRKKRER